MIEKYFGGTGITLDKLKKVMPTINVDGTTYQIEDWLKECEKFDKLVPNKSKVWIPYNVWKYNTVIEVVWDKYKFKTYSFPEEMNDWWVSEPYCKVAHENGEYFVYEISFYKRWKRKTQMSHILEQEKKPKRKFFSSKEIAEFKKAEAIENSKANRS
jgi:hypothetical protein